MKTVLFLLVLALPEVVFAQRVQPEYQIPIAPGINDGSVRQSEKGATICIQAEHDLDQEIEEINAKLFKMETNPASGYYVRHQDRMEIIKLLHAEMTPYRDQIHHAIFLGNGKYCLDKLSAGVKLANSIYQANLAYRKNGR